MAKIQLAHCILGPLHIKLGFDLNAFLRVDYPLINAAGSTLAFTRLQRCTYNKKAHFTSASRDIEGNRWCSEITYCALSTRGNRSGIAIPHAEETVVSQYSMSEKLYESALQGDPRVSHY